MNNHLPELIAEYEKRIGRNVEQKEIAQGSGVPEGTLSRYINGRIGSTKFDIEFKLCKFFSEVLDRPIRRDNLYSFEFE